MSGKENPKFGRFKRTISGDSQNMNINYQSKNRSPGLVYRRIPSQKSIRKDIQCEKTPKTSPISHKMIPTSLTKARQARKKSITISKMESNNSNLNQNSLYPRTEINSSTLNRNQNKSQNQSLYDAERSERPIRKLSRMRGASRELIRRSKDPRRDLTPENHDESVFRSKNDESMMSNISGISRNKVRMRSRSRKAGSRRENSVKLTFTPQKRKKTIQRVTPQKSEKKSKNKKILPKSLKKTPDRGRKGFEKKYDGKNIAKFSSNTLQRRNSNQDLKQVKPAENYRPQYQSELGARNGLFKERQKKSGLLNISNRQMIIKDQDAQNQNSNLKNRETNQNVVRGRQRQDSIKMQRINESISYSSDEGVSNYTGKINKSRDIISQKSIGSINNGNNNSKRTSSRRYLEERQKKAWVRNSKRELHIKNPQKIQPVQNQQRRRSSKQPPIAIGILSTQNSEPQIEQILNQKMADRKKNFETLTNKKIEHLEVMKDRQKRFPTFGSKQGSSELENNLNPQRIRVNRDKISVGKDPKNVSLDQTSDKKKRENKKQNKVDTEFSIDMIKEFQNKFKQVTSMSGNQRKRINHHDENQQKEKSRFKQVEVHNQAQKNIKKENKRTSHFEKDNYNNINKKIIEPERRIHEVENSIDQSQTTFFEHQSYQKSDLKRLYNNNKEQDTIEYSTQHFNNKRSSGEIPKPQTITFEHESNQQNNPEIQNFNPNPGEFILNKQLERDHNLSKNRFQSFETQNNQNYNEMLKMAKVTDERLQKMDSRVNPNSQSSFKPDQTNPSENDIKQLMWLNSSGDIELNEKTLSHLEKIDHDLKVVSVIGPYRSGKSFLLNRLNNSQGGFHIGNSTNPCTQGVWLWGLSESESLNSSNKRKNSTILLDTEGLFAYNRNEVFDSKLFLFTACVSSLMIYNSFGVINESAIEKFNFIINLGKHVQLAKSEKKANKKMLNSELAKLFPRLIWLLRDFTLNLTENNQQQPSDPDEYMERALFQRENWDKNSSKSLVRRSFKEVFPMRNCFTLVRPVNDENQLRNIENIPFESLRIEFREELSKLLSFIKHKATTKMVEGHALNGKSFVEFIRQIAHSLNQDSFPEISTVADRVGVFERKRILNKLMRTYAKKTKSLYEALPQSETGLSEKLEIWKLEALAQAQSPWLKGSALKELYKNAMKAFLQFDKELYIKNVEKSTEQCDNLAKEVLLDFEKKVQALKKNLSEIEISIDDLNQGPLDNENDFIKSMTRKSLLNDVFPRSQSFSKRDTLNSKNENQGKIMKIKDYERNKKILIREISNEINNSQKKFFEKAKGPSKIRSFLTKLSPQLNLQFNGLLKEAAFKDSMTFEEFKLQYEKLKTKCLTLDTMIMTQKKNIDQLMKENREQKEHHQIVMREKSKQEHYKWENYINKTEKMYKNLEENNSKKIQHSMNVQTDLLKEIGKIREEFRNVTYAINEDKENMNRINQQKIINQEKEYLQMQNKVKIAELKETIERERRELERQNRQNTDSLMEQIERLREENDEMKSKMYKRETQIRLLQQKIREEEQTKHDQIEFSQTLCNISDQVMRVLRKVERKV